MTNHHPAVALSTFHREVWRYIAARMAEGRGAPTLKEIAGALRCSFGGARYAVQVLEARGYLTRAAGKCRAFTLFVWPGGAG